MEKNYSPIVRPLWNRRNFMTATSAGLGLAAGMPAIPSPAFAQEHKGQGDLLSRQVTAEKLAAVLLPREKWAPYPAAGERAAWNALPSDTRQELIEAGERNLGAEWPSLPATLFLDFSRTGARSHYEARSFLRRSKLCELVIAECVEGKSRFVDEITNGIWAICEESYWGVPAHLRGRKADRILPNVAQPGVDLFAAETSALLAWTEYLLGPALDQISPLIRQRIWQEVNRRILTPALDRIDFEWMGLDPRFPNKLLNNWNPWVNSNWLTSTLLLERDDARRRASVLKIIRSLDRFLWSYHEDGGCDEGPVYWGHAGGSLFECLELLGGASNGALDFYHEPLIREIGRYIYRAHIADDYYTNFADARAKLKAPGDLIFRFGRRIGDERMQALGAFAAARGSVSDGSIARRIEALFNLSRIRQAPKSPPLARDVWLPGIQVMAARRKEGSVEGLYLAAQGGHNAESHNHNDVGNFIIYADGKPVIIDVGVETYTSKTFGPQRYEIWTMQSAFHNLPTIDGVMQSAGREFKAKSVSHHASDAAVEFALNIEGAYPAEAGLEMWKRTFRLDRNKNEILIKDSYALKKAASRITVTLMTPCQVSPGDGGVLRLKDAATSTGAVVIYDEKAFTPTVEEIAIKDKWLQASWGGRLYRILLTAEKPPIRADWTIRFLQVN